MMIAVCGFLIMAIGSIGLPTPDALAASGIEKDALVSPNWLISTYLVLTFAELSCHRWVSLSFRNSSSQVQRYDDGWLVCCNCHW